MSTTSAERALLASIVSIPRYLKYWRKLDDSEPLAELRSEFWGRGMAEDEEVRRVDQQSNFNPRNGEDDESEDDGKAGYVLEIESDAIYMDKIFVRAEYIRIYDYIVDHYDKKTKFWGKAPLAVVTGQPGIGKSIWNYYALCRCLAERRPVIWRYKLQPYMFVEDGVYDMGKDFLKATYKSFVWTLIDSDDCESQTCIPVEFVHHGSRFFVIYASSPASERWSRAHKTVSFPEVVVMNPWSRSEIHRAASLHLDSPNLEIIDKIFDRFGPTPRLCFDVLSNNRWFKKHKDETQRALDDLTMESLRTSINDLEGLKMNGISDKLCLIRRSKKHDLYSDTLVMPITDYIRSELVIRMRKSSLRQLIETYHKFFPIHPLRGMCGAIFESICHRRFQEQIFIRYMRMVRLPWSGSKLHSSHHTIENQDLEERREVAFHESVILDVRPSRARVYDGQGLDPEPGVYYLAKKPGQASLDSFILYDDILYIFRFTVSGEQGIKDELIAECAKLSIPEGRWLFIFVIPDGVKFLKCPYPKSLGLQRLEPRSAQITMEKSAFIPAQAHLQGNGTEPSVEATSDEANEANVIQVAAEEGYAELPEDITAIIESIETNYTGPSSDTLAKQHSAAETLQFYYRRLLTNRAIRIANSGLGLPRIRQNHFKAFAQAAESIKWPERSLYRPIFLGALPHLLTCLDYTWSIVMEEKKKVKRQARQSEKHQGIEVLMERQMSLNTTIKRIKSFQTSLEASSSFHKSRDLKQLEVHLVAVSAIVDEIPRAKEELAFDLEMACAWRLYLEAQERQKPKIEKPALNVGDLDGLYDMI